MSRVQSYLTCVEFNKCNLYLIIDDPDSYAVWKGLRSTPSIKIQNPDSGRIDCSDRCCPIYLHGAIMAAVVLPDVAD
jgi:hypothetical protein